MLEASKSHTVMQRRMEHFSTFLQRITRLGKTWCPSHLIYFVSGDARESQNETSLR